NARENGVEQGFSPALRQDRCRASAPEGLTSAAKAALPTMQHTAGLKACSTLSTLRSRNRIIYEMTSQCLPTITMSVGALPPSAKGEPAMGETIPVLGFTVNPEIVLSTLLTT